MFTLCRPLSKKWIDNENIQSHPCFQEGNNQAQPCFQESGISFTAAFSIYKDCSNQYWTSELIADFSEDTHKIDCDWSRIKTSFNPTLAPKCTLQLYCDTSPSKFLELAGTSVLSIDKIYSYGQHTNTSPWFYSLLLISLLLNHLLYFELHPVQCFSSNYQISCVCLLYEWIACVFGTGLNIG